MYFVLRWAKNKDIWANEKLNCLCIHGCMHMLGLVLSRIVGASDTISSILTIPCFYLHVRWSRVSWSPWRQLTSSRPIPAGHSSRRSQTRSCATPQLSCSPAPPGKNKTMNWRLLMKWKSNKFLLKFWVRNVKFYRYIAIFSCFFQNNSIS